jgi:hypothetical protein
LYAGSAVAVVAFPADPDADYRRNPAIGAVMRQRSLSKAGIGIGISVVVGWLYWAVLFGPDRLNAPFF